VIVEFSTAQETGTASPAKDRNIGRYLDMPDGSKTIWCVAWQLGGKRTTTVAVEIAATINQSSNKQESRMFTLKFSTANAVFDGPYTADAIADALLAVSKRVRQRGLDPAHGPIVDNNGNTIGSYKYTDK
jgi:hypothetical protein